MKRLICWFFGHQWEPIQNREEIRKQLHRLIETKALINFCRCKRCGQHR